MQAALGIGAGGLDAQIAEHKAVARLRAKGAEGAVVVQHDQGLVVAARNALACLRQFGIECGHLLCGQRLFVKDAAQGQQMVFDDRDVLGMAVLEIHIQVEGRRDLAERLVVVGLQGRDQDQVGL